MSTLSTLLLVVALTLLVLPIATMGSTILNRILTRLSLQLFGGIINSPEDEDLRLSGIQSSRLDALRGAHVAQTYRVYASKTLLYATLVALGGSILGVFVVQAIFYVLGIPPETMRALLPGPFSSLAGQFEQPALTATEAFGLFVLVSGTLGMLSAVTVHQLRWWWPAYKGGERARKIDSSMERTVAFVYALSRSGMAFPKVMSILAANRRVYGEAAREVEVAVRDMEFFGTDLVAALTRLSNRSPSENMSEFTENLASVLQSGRSLSEFLRDQYDYYREESEAQQQQFLELLATLAEAYVTVFVAGPLFLITVLVILGLVIGNTLPFLRAFGYLLIPLATVGFAVYLDSLSATSTLGTDRERTDSDSVTFRDVRKSEAASDQGIADGGQQNEQVNRGRLRAYNEMRWFRKILQDPLRYVRRNPASVFWVTVPLALVYLGLTIGGPLSAWFSRLSTTGTLFGATNPFPVEQLDEPLIHVLVFLLGSFSVIYEYRRRELRRIEAVMPDFLDRLASANEAGMSVVASLERVANSNLGALNTEMDRTWTDIKWGTSVQDALNRFERRLNTPTVTRATTLITNAMESSGRLGPVLRIAADEAQATRRLQEQRRQELLTYVIVIYVSFFVFLAIVVALSVAFLPNIPDPSEFGQDFGAGFGGISEAQKAAYQLVFFHTATIQALCSGLIAGQMGQGSIKDGAKHATIMVLIAYIVFIVVT